MQLGMSTSGYAQDCSITECMRRIKSAGYDSVDFDFYDYSSPDGPMMQSDWMLWIEGVRRVVFDSGLIVGQTHAQLGLFAKPNLEYEPPAEIFYRNIKACAMLGCSEIVFHPVFYSDVVETEELHEKLMDYNVRWFRDLAESAKASGVYIDIENTCDGRLQKLHAPFTRASDMMNLIERIGDESFGICLDTGHAHIMSQDIPNMIRVFGSRLRTLHLNDNLGKITPVHPDQHFFPGTGTINFNDVFRALKEIDFHGIINLEPGDFLIRLPVLVRDAVITGGALTAKAYMKDVKL